MTSARSGRGCGGMSPRKRILSGPDHLGEALTTLEKKGAAHQSPIKTQSGRGSQLKARRYYIAYRDLTRDELGLTPSNEFLGILEETTRVRAGRARDAPVGCPMVEKPLQPGVLVRGRQAWPAGRSGHLADVHPVASVRSGRRSHTLPGVSETCEQIVHCHLTGRFATLGQQAP